MGIQFGDLIEPRKISLEELKGMAVAFDDHNIVYQFLSTYAARRAHKRKVPISDPHAGKIL